MNVKHKLIKLPFLGLLLLFVYRVFIIGKYLAKCFKDAFIWLVRSNEITNFTYDLTGLNKQYMASLISVVTSVDYQKVYGFIDEIDHDVDLKRHIEKATTSSDLALVADIKAGFARRVGWYAFVRATKPKVVVETGVDKGLGSCVIAAAIRKNAGEGFEGRYFGTDINPEAGYLLSGEYGDYGEILYGDSIKSLKNFGKPIDLFINDSDHSAGYEGKEYQIVRPLLKETSIVLGDNSHVTDELLKFAMQNSMKFLYFQEAPLNHWYPGGGIGVAYK